MAKFYTAARRIPLAIGTLDGRTRIPGGPYTLREAVIFLLLVGAGLITTTFGGYKQGLWSTGMWIIDGLVIFIIAAAGVAAIRFIPLRRNLFYLLVGLWRAYNRPATGTIDGKPVRARKTLRQSHRFRITEGL